MTETEALDEARRALETVRKIAEADPAGATFWIRRVADGTLTHLLAAETKAERYREALEHALRALLDEGLPPITAEAAALEALCEGLGYASADIARQALQEQSE